MLQQDYQMKTITARLLANENIQVEYGAFETAFFDTKLRILGMPLWSLTDPDMVDMLIGHEVSHALHTPPEGWHTVSKRFPDCPKSYINIVEDIRIERLIIDKYPGLLASFVRGYGVMLKNDVFEMKGREMASYGFMDRLNIKTKFRTLVDVPFLDEEMHYVQLACSCETFDDVLEACREIYAWLKERNKHSFHASQDVVKSSDSESQKGEQRATEVDDNESGNGEERGSNVLGEKGGSQFDGNFLPAAGDYLDPEKCETDDAQRAYEHQHASNNAVPALYRIPTEKQVESFFYSADELMLSRRAYNSKLPSAKAYAKFMRKIEPRVNQLVKEFEMRKSAYRSKRARVSSRGSLDVNKLYRYKYDDRLFQQVTTLADAKKHGIQILIDFSISMRPYITNTLRQVLILAEFCRRTQIPFQVWMFTSNAYVPIAGVVDKTKRRWNYHSLPHVVMCGLNMVCLLDSKMKKADYREACLSLYNIKREVTPLTNYMGGTPLNESILVMAIKLDVFKRNNNLDKTSLIVFTDGEGSNLLTVDGSSEFTQYGDNVNKSIIFDNKVIRLPASPYAERRTLFELIRSRGHNVIHMHLANTKELVDLYEQFNGETNISLREFRTDLQTVGVSTLKDVGGCDAIIGITPAGIEVDEKVVDLGGSIHQNSVVNAFKEVGNSKKSSKIIAQAFAKIVA